LRALFACAILLLLFLPSCNDDGNALPLEQGIVREYWSNDLNSCGWVIEIPQTDGTLRVLKPLNLDPFYESDFLVVLISYNLTGGLTTCSFDIFSLVVEDVVIVDID